MENLKNVNITDLSEQDHDNVFHCNFNCFHFFFFRSVLNNRVFVCVSVCASVCSGFPSLIKNCE